MDALRERFAKNLTTTLSTKVGSPVPKLLGTPSRTGLQMTISFSELPTVHQLAHSTKMLRATLSVFASAVPKITQVTSSATPTSDCLPTAPTRPLLSALNGSLTLPSGSRLTVLTSTAITFQR